MLFFSLATGGRKGIQFLYAKNKKKRGGGGKSHGLMAGHTSQAEGQWFNYP